MKLPPACTRRSGQKEPQIKSAGDRKVSLIWERYALAGSHEFIDIRSRNAPLR